MEQDGFARECVAPDKGIKKSAFFEAINNRGLEQLSEVFEQLVKQAGGVLPAEYAHLGQLVAIDGSLIDAVLSMEWADYRSGSKKAKAHFGFDINRGLMVQLLAGLITYLLLAIYCREQHQETVSISRVRELRNQIANEVTESRNRNSRKHGQSNKISKLKRKRRKARA